MGHAPFWGLVHVEESATSHMTNHVDCGLSPPTKIFPNRVCFPLRVCTALGKGKSPDRGAGGTSTTLLGVGGWWRGSCAFTWSREASPTPHLVAAKVFSDRVGVFIGVG